MSITIETPELGNAIYPGGSEDGALRFSKTFDRRVLCCPECGNDCTHQGAIRETAMGKGGGIAIAFECEGEHKFSVHIYQHKGSTFIEYGD